MPKTLSAEEVPAMQKYRLYECARTTTFVGFLLVPSFGQIWDQLPMVEYAID